MHDIKAHISPYLAFVDDMTRVSVIIVNWNTRDLLGKCLESLASERTADGKNLAEVIVADNNSSDGSVAMVSERFRWVQLIENSQNAGFACANNLAIAASQGELLLLLNPDTVVQPGALQALVDFMARHPEAGAAGSRLLNPDGSLQPSCSPAPTLAREFWRLLHLDLLYPFGNYAMQGWPVDLPHAVDVVQGAALIVRRSVLEQIGLFDEDYFIYSEEVDLCQRIRAAGWQIFWVPKSTVIHYGGQSTRQVAAAMFQQLYLAKIFYFRKQHGLNTARLYKLILALTSLPRLLLAPLALLGAHSARQQRLSMAHNYWQLLVNLPQM